jgi:transposase
MNEHLRETSSQVGPGAHAALLLDQAGWPQAGRRLCVPDNATLLPLPPHSPELNPMENVWEHLRANRLCALVWDSHDAILKACKEAWTFLVSEPARIRSIGSRDWACVSL